MSRVYFSAPLIFCVNDGMLVAVTSAGIWNVPVALGLPLVLLRLVTRRALFFSCCSTRDERHVERPEPNLQLGGKPCRTQARWTETQLTTQVWSINKYLTNTTGFRVACFKHGGIDYYIQFWPRVTLNHEGGVSTTSFSFFHLPVYLPVTRASSDNARESIWQTVKIVQCK